jgi:hypothetical protein
VIRRESQDDFWLNLGLVFEHKDGKGFNIVLQALPLDVKSYAARSLRTKPNSPGRSSLKPGARRR